MLTKGHKKYLKNPTLALTIYIVFFLCFLFTYEVRMSLVAALIYGAAVEIFLRYYAKSKVSYLSFGVCLVAIFLTLITNLFLEPRIYRPGIYILFSEIYLVTLLLIARGLKNRTIRSKFWVKHYSQKPFLDDFYETATFIQYAITFDLFITLIYIYLREDYIVVVGDGPMDYYFFVWQPLAMIGGLIVYEFVKIRRVSSRLRKESWLPIVNEKGEVTGRIAKSESFILGNRFMHPVVRIAVVHEDEIYLQVRPDDWILNPKVWDHPYEQYLTLNEEISIVAKDMVADILENDDDASLRFLIKYSFVNETTNRLVFLYILRIESEDVLSEENMNGKFWTMRQIENNMEEDDVFGECFLQEYEYMKNTILMAERIKKATKEQER